jgi:UDP-N-acetylglucosamine 2-epimerase (non-hydrolysing)
VSVKLGIPVAHVEAGLRSFDRTMPEEINRLLTDAIAEYLFVTEPSGVENLRREGVEDRKVHLVGNVMIDSLIRYREKAKGSDIHARIGVDPRSFILVTLHRPSNVDRREGLEKIMTIFEHLGARMPIVFPVHPRTRKMLREFGFGERLQRNRGLRLTEPLGYLDFLRLMDTSALVLTDSGGIQEETTYLGIPCLTLRENTERPITVEVGTNELCGLDADLVIRKGTAVLDGKGKTGRVPELWDGRAAQRIARIIFDGVSGS